MNPSTPDELILKHLQGALTGPERVRLEDWLRRDTQHRQQVEQSQMAWQLAPDPAIRTDFATGPEWQKLAAHLQLDTATQAPDVPKGKSILFEARR